MGGDSGSKQTQETRTQIDPRLAGQAKRALTGASEFFDRGTDEIFQGSRLVGVDPNVQAAQNRLLQQSQGIQQQIAQQQGQAFQNLLGAGDINNELTRDRIAAQSELIGREFAENVLPQIQQGATGAGQFGSSRQGIAEGLAAGRAADAISNAALQELSRGQNVALQAQQLAPSVQQALLTPAATQLGVGESLQAREQQELFDLIQQQEAPRLAELQRLGEFQTLLASNPLIGNTTQTATTTQQAGSNPFQTALGAGLAVGGLETAGGGTLLGNLLSGTKKKN